MGITWDGNGGSTVVNPAEVKRTDKGKYIWVQEGELPTPNYRDTKNAVTGRFGVTLQVADQMLDLLLGTEDTDGYLDILYGLIKDFTPTTITATDVETNVQIDSVGNAPAFDNTQLETLPTFGLPDPEMTPLPSVDVSTLIPPETPADINPSIDWDEINLNQDIYQQLLERISEDLVYGATGLTDAVQEDIYNSGIERQRRANDKANAKIAAEMATRGSSIPTGAYLGAMTELEAEKLAQSTEINRTVTISQAELAQKNSQFIIEQARMLETLLRDTRNQDSNRKLDYEKSVATLVIQVYTEKVKLYIAIAQANVAYVQAQVENLKAVSAHNLALIDQFKAQLEAYSTEVKAVGDKNTNYTQIYESEMKGFGIEATAISQENATRIEKAKLDLGEADLVLRAAIASAAHALGGYTASAQLKEKIVTDMAAIASQSLASALGSVNASASLGYTGSETKSEGWSHSDQLGESHSYQEEPST